MYSCHIFFPRSFDDSPTKISQIPFSLWEKTGILKLLKCTEAAWVVACHSSPDFRARVQSDTDSMTRQRAHSFRQETEQQPWRVWDSFLLPMLLSAQDTHSRWLTPAGGLVLGLVVWDGHWFIGGGVLTVKQLSVLFRRVCIIVQKELEVKNTCLCLECRFQRHTPESLWLCTWVQFRSLTHWKQVNRHPYRIQWKPDNSHLTYFEPCWFSEHFSYSESFR